MRAHAVWGPFCGGFAGAARAAMATGVLGAWLALVYVIGHRVLAPCVAAHVLINALGKPGLVLAAVRGEFSPGRRMGESVDSACN